MSKFLRHEQCPKCAKRGADRRGNNLGVWDDGGAYCFSCGYRRSPTFKSSIEGQLKFLTKEQPNDKEKAVLPTDFSREVPAEGWKWLLQYGIPMSYWKAHCGFTEKENRLVFTIGTPTKFSIGRALSVGVSKWKVYGDKTSHVEVVGEQLPGEIILVEDLISAHKVALAGYTSIPLFGTTIHDGVVKKLQALKRPVRLWLDSDQYSLLSKKIGRLHSLLGVSVGHMYTYKDPKEYSVQEIKEILR
jgi:hypothetical protein